MQSLEQEQIVLVQAELRRETPLLNEHPADPIQMSQYFPEDHFFPLHRTAVQVEQIAPKCEA